MEKNKNNIYYSFFAVKSFPKLEKGNAAIHELESTVNAIAPGSGGFMDWDERGTGYYGILFGKNIKKDIDFNLSLTYAKGAVDNHKTGIINTVIAPYNAVTGQRLATDFRQEYTSKTIAFGPRFFKKIGQNTEISLAPKVSFVDFSSDTDYSLITPGIASSTSLKFEAKRFYPILDFEIDRKWKFKNGRELSVGLIIEYVPTCRMNSDATGYEVNNGVRTAKSMPGEIDLSSKKPNIGLIFNYSF